ncbi:MAG: winged helix-turn-helix transcriptional regulator [Candidatus Bathyarchaeia archaeon]
MNKIPVKLFLTFTVFTIILFSLTHLVVGVDVDKLTLTVYEDGVVHVEQKILLTTFQENVTVKLLTSDVENLLVMGENGITLSYELIFNELVIYNNLSREVTIHYDTAALTFKNGSLWTLEICLPVETTLILPSESMIISLSGVPKIIASERSSLKLVVGPGSWKIEYMIRIPSRISSESDRQMDFYTTIFIVPVGGLITLFSVMVYLKRRRSNLKDLSDDERKVLELVRKRKRVSETEIRALTHLPKTTIWRIVRRLERRGLVRVVQVNRRNEVEPA